MGPKKDKSKEKPQTKKIKCPNYDRGYCKYGEECFKIHPDKVCEEPDCFNDQCDKRHPNPCKFSLRCTFYRKNICLYSHVTTASGHENFNALENKFNKKFTVIENQANGMINKFEKIINDKFTQFESQIGNLRNDLEIKNAQISALEIRMEEMEKEHLNHKKKQEKKIKDLENACKQKFTKQKVSEPIITEETSIQCEKCEYTTTSRQGLKIHNSKVHSKINFEEFPAACDICEKVLSNTTDLKKHKKSQHTYHNVRYQCNECEFMANEVETINVHFGRKHSNKNQCGLCDKNFETSTILNEHLTQCELFMCTNSGCRETFGTLIEMKDHINSEHRKNSPAHYSFSYCIVDSKDRSEKEINKKHHTIYAKDW